MRRAVIVTVAALVLAGGASGAGAPPGASARCRDGTYSFSQHRSGTCSHHGGVAAWLSGGGATAASPTAPAVHAGATVLLAPRTRTGGCVLGARPDRRCSPGAYAAGLTAAVLCAPGFRTETIRDVPEEEKHAVELEYGLAPRAYGHTLEIDHIVPLEVGGSNAIANLFPERAPGYHLKDRLENRLHDLVCSGRLGLRAAQRQIAANWQALSRELLG